MTDLATIAVALLSGGATYSALWVLSPYIEGDLTIARRQLLHTKVAAIAVAAIVAIVGLS